MQITIVTGQFPVLSQSFITNKVLSLARSGLQVRVMAIGRGDVELARDVLANAPRELTVCYLPERDHPAAAALRLPKLLSAALLRSRGDTLRMVSLVRARYGRGAQAMKHLYRLLPFAGERPDVMHFEFASKAADLRELFEVLPCPKVVSCRGSDVGIMPLLNPATAEGLQRVLSRADRVHCVSEETLRRAERCGARPEQAFINYPSIDPEYFRPSSPSRRGSAPPTIISVGRTHWVKGYEYALQAMHRLRSQGLRFRYQIVGGGDYEGAVRFAVWELGLEAEVELLGPQPRERVRELLNGADVYLLPSVSEGISNTALEAMAMELPIVTTAAGGMAEAVLDGSSGFVVPTREPAAMAERLAPLLREPDLRTEFGRSARARVQQSFTLERQTGRFIEQYRQLAAAAPRVSRAAVTAAPSEEGC